MGNEFCAYVLLIWCVALCLRAASFRGLDDLAGGAFRSVAYGVSADGTVVVGESVSSRGTEAFRWTATNGMIGLGDLPGGVFASSASAVSADGKVIVGTSSGSTGGAFRWTAKTGMITLGDLPGGSIRSMATAVSAGGEVIVGESSSSRGEREAFRWTATNGMTGLGDLPGGNFLSVAYAVSADGSVIVGYSSSSNGNEAFRWTQSTGMVPLGDLPGGQFNSIAYAIAADGSVIVGRGFSDAPNSIHEAFRWTVAAGLARLGFALNDYDSVAWAVSADGNTIVGDDPFPVSDFHAVIWQPERGMRVLRNVLISDYELDLTGWQLTSARAISPDGSMIAGAGLNPAGQGEAWIADLAPPRLEITRAGDNIVLLWKTNGPSFSLEHASSVASSLWNAHSAPAVTVADSFIVTNTASASHQFFRLRKP